MISLGERIKKARKEKGLTQSELADNNISRSMLSLIENGMTNPSMSTLEYIANKLEKPVAHFLTDSFDILEKSESLIIVLEQLIKSDQYQQAIDKINEFKAQFSDDDFSKLQVRMTGILYAFLGISYYNLGDPSAKEYLIKAIEKLSDTEATIYLCKSYNYLGLIIFNEANFQQMEVYLLKAYNLLDDTTFDSVYLKLNIAHNLALAYYKQQKYNEAIELITNTFMYNTKYELYHNFGQFNMLLALCYKNTNNIDAAIKSNSKAISYYTFIDEAFMLHRCYVNLSILYRLLKDSYNSVLYINKAIDYFESTNNVEFLLNARVEKIISMFLFKTDYNLIKDMANILVNDPNISKLLRGELLCILGTIELQNKNLDKALVLLQEAESSIQDNINSEMNIFVYKGLSEIYQQSSDVHNEQKYNLKFEQILKSKPYYRELL